MNPSSLPNLPSIHWSQAFLCQASRVYIHLVKETDKQASSLPVVANIDFILFLIPLGSKDSSSLSSWRRSTTWTRQVPVHRESLWAGQESLKCDSRMCLLEYCHWKPLNWKLVIEKSSLEQPKENAGVWVQSEESANSFEIQMPALRHIWKQALPLLI